MKLLDLGSGPNPRPKEGYEAYGIDIVPSDNKNVKVADLTWSSIPFADETFDLVTAFDFLEHVPMRVWYVEQTPFGTVGKTRDVMVSLFDEVYRVLKPGGIFHTFTPHLPHTSEVYRDPTHVSVWVEQSWDYWAGPMTELMRHYGYKAEFTIVRKERAGAHFIVDLQKGI